MMQNSESPLENKSISMDGIESSPSIQEVRNQYAFVLFQIRSVRASLTTPSLSPDTIEGRLTSCVLRVNAVFLTYGDSFKQIEGYSHENINQQILKLEQLCYASFTSQYLSQAENKFEEFFKELSQIAENLGFRYDTTDRTFAEATRYFRASVRCYQLARAKGVTFLDDSKIIERINALLKQVRAFLIPSLDTAVTLGSLSGDALIGAMRATEAGQIELSQGYLPGLPQSDVS